MEVSVDKTDTSLADNKKNNATTINASWRVIPMAKRQKQVEAPESS
jgi:hypothetical protein